MKKICLSIAALLLGLLAHSQEADTLGRHAELTVIPRFDVGLTSQKLSNKGQFDKAQFNLGNSSLYTLFEGSLSEHISFTLINHWLAFGEDAPRWLYDGTLRSDTPNWIDYCSVEFNTGAFTFGVGKEMILLGGFEFDPWDYDSHPEINSIIWNVLPSYQWGVRAGVTTPSEMTTFTLQMCSSPFGEHPFASGLWAWSGQWSGSYGPFSTLWNATAAQTPAGKLEWMVCLGQKLELGDWTLGFDWFNRQGQAEPLYDDTAINAFEPQWYNPYWSEGHTLMGTVAWSPLENLEIQAKYMYEGSTPFSNEKVGFRTGGLAAHYFVTDSIRLHALAGYSDLNDLFANVGITVYLNVNKLFSK